MISDKKTIEILKKTEALLEGHFILSSGLRSEKYVQCAKLMMQGAYAEKLCKSLSEKIKKTKIKFDLVVSPALGGVLVGYEVSKHLKIPNIFVERVDNVFQLRRSFTCNNKKILIIEDVITTGKSSLECAEVIKENGGIIKGFACLIDRSGPDTKISNIISQIKLNIPTYSENNLPDKLKKIPAVKPGSRKI